MDFPGGYLKLHLSILQFSAPQTKPSDKATLIRIFNPNTIKNKMPYTH
jgi:hypothetical protein